MLNNETLVCGVLGLAVHPIQANEAYQWITHAVLMNHAGYSHAMTKNDRYVSGRIGTPTAERYVKADNTYTWNIIVPMPTHRSALAAATLSGVIYACGGMPSQYTSCEKYDPVANNWVGSTSPMNTGGYGLNLVAMEKEGELYAFTAGLSGTTDVEWLDPTNGLWTALTDHMMESRRYAEADHLK